MACGLPSAVWAVAFAMRHATSVVEAVKVFDMAAYDDLVTIDEICRCTAAVMGTRTGTPQLRSALPLLSENSWSPQEPGLRCAWHLDGHRPMPLANRPVFDLDGRHVGTPDVIDVEAGVYGQYEGSSVHLVGAQRSTDVRQDAAYRALGLEGVTMVAEDCRDTRSFVRPAARGVRREQAVARRTSVGGCSSRHRGGCRLTPSSYVERWWASQRDTAARVSPHRCLRVLEVAGS